MAKRAKKPRNDLVVSGLSIPGRKGPGLQLNAYQANGRPSLYLFNEHRNAISISFEFGDDARVNVSQDTPENFRNGAGMNSGVFGGGMGISFHVGHQHRIVEFNEGGLIVRSTVGDPDEAGIRQSLMVFGDRRGRS